MTKKLLGNLKEGLLFILSAPAGTGKTTLMDRLRAEFPCIVASVSYTTRAPRGGEVDGEHYHFIDEPLFKKMIKEDQFLEYVELYGKYYGTARAKVTEQLKKGRHVFLVIDTQGMKKLKGKIPLITIFISPPSLQELKKRLKARNTETEESLQKRLHWAEKEIEAKNNYDYLIVNDDLAIAYESLKSIVIAEEHKIR
jgi:guanylate kinase